MRLDRNSLSQLPPQWGSSSATIAIDESLKRKARYQVVVHFRRKKLSDKESYRMLDMLGLLPQNE